MKPTARWLTFGMLLVAASLLSAAAHGGEMELVVVGDSGQDFVLESSRRPFPVWGVNYDHDRSGRLIEDYWHDEWPTIEEDFAEIKALGCNVVRVHLQLARFMESAEQPNEASLRQLARLVSLAEKQGLYLDLTGLGCYHKQDVPPWFDALDEAERWAVQGRFWEAVAKTCAASPAIFCYDLMNEPVVSAGMSRKDWLGPAFAGKHFVQFITRDLAGRARPEVARQWIATLVAAIRKHDQRHLVTVGLVPWSLDRPGLTSGFVPEKIADQLDFLAVHLYPESGKLPQARETLDAFTAVGKPVVVEETFPLKCSPEELERFIDQSQDVGGWIGFYWGQTEEECRATGTLAGAITADWLATLKRLAKRDGGG
jgi:hypothetical protein